MTNDELKAMQDRAMRGNSLKDAIDAIDKDLLAFQDATNEEHNSMHIGVARDAAQNHLVFKHPDGGWQPIRIPRGEDSYTEIRLFICSLIKARRKDLQDRFDAL